MTVFGIGTLELVLILLLLILIFGPERINEMGRWLGQAYRKLTGLSSEVNQQVMDVRRAMDSTLDTAGISKSIREAADEVNSIQRDINKSVSEGTAAVKNLQTDVEKAIAETKDELTIDVESTTDEPKSRPAEPELAVSAEGAGEPEPPADGPTAPASPAEPGEPEPAAEELVTAVSDDNSGEVDA